MHDISRGVLGYGEEGVGGWGAGRWTAHYINFSALVRHYFCFYISRIFKKSVQLDCTARSFSCVLMSLGFPFFLFSTLVYIYIWRVIARKIETVSYAPGCCGFRPLMLPFLGDGWTA